MNKKDKDIISMLRENCTEEKVPESCIRICSVVDSAFCNKPEYWCTGCRHSKQFKEVEKRWKI